jgi:diacylglycerol kinase (ATP)
MSSTSEEKTFLILNPHAGRSRARKRVDAFLERHASTIEVHHTNAPGHARQLARAAASDGRRVIAAAGGDGTVHEVACGILDSGNLDTRMAVVPIGSANDFAWSIQRNQSSNRESKSAAEEQQSKLLKVDVGQVNRPGHTPEYFIESLGTGLSGRVTVESRKIANLQGVMLYTLATIRALQNSEPQVMRIKLDDKQFAHRTLLFSVMSGKREGSFLLAPDARMDDGLFDYVHAGNIGRLRALALLPRIALFGTPRSHPKIGTGQCRTIEIETDWDLTVHVDGEILARPEDRLRQLSISLLPARLEVELLQV